MQLLITSLSIHQLGMDMGEPVKLPMKKGLGQTDRTDGWWKGPTAMASYLGFMIIYATWRGFMEADFWIFSDFGYSAGVGHGAGTMAIENTGSHVLSPLYSPLIIPGSGELGSMVPVALAWMSPAMFILIFPAGFRGTCYYYRKAYYRAFFQQPTGCAVSTPWNEYSGETRLLVIQNLHRYFMYAAVIYLPILAWDFWLSINFHHPETHEHSFGVSMGSLLLFANVMMLSGYTFGCHAFRHVIGGGANDWTSSKWARFKHRLWKWSTSLNEHHKDWALYSLFVVMFADFYIWACTDPLFGWNDIVLLGGF
ncbi:MAG: hypothetical protein CMA04_003210 [Methanobacteriota archaeon]|nr:MAG: hypothetical protein CMA04_003210 [Euryarchaeota archaeon]|tara:strand:+ start:3276 stop:4205 length:930 start_codon:yes stop_codon:yes gene_type:complete